MTLTDRTGRMTPIREVRVFVFDEETGIGSIAGEPNTTSILYDLSGRRVSSPRKGIYIQNGKKYLMK